MPFQWNKLTNEHGMFNSNGNSRNITLELPKLCVASNSWRNTFPTTHQDESKPTNIKKKLIMAKLLFQGE